MSMIEEFKKFAFKGNVVDLAVGVVIGGAFGKIVSALVDNVIMPPIAALMPNPDWKTAGYALGKEVEIGGKKVQASIGYGALGGALLDFLIVALVLFMVVQAINKAMPKKEEAPAGPPPQEKLLAEIRDLLAKK
jgi:large conductance mechanosensitive channel